MQSRLIVIGVFLVALVIGVVVISASGEDEDPGTAAATTKPEVEVPDGPPPEELETTDITEGDGPEAQPGSSITVQYVGVTYSDGTEFDSSWEKPEPFSFQLGTGAVIPGWDEGIVGMKVGGRRELVIPSDLAYGKQGFPPDIGPNEPLVFVVDLLEVQAPAG